MKLQKTIKSQCKIAGKGLFGGEDVKMVFRPGPEDTGIVFVRTDVPEPVHIRAIWPNVAQRSRRTSLKKGSVALETVEHCLAAVTALEIDNLVIEVQGAELPAPDCSSIEFFRVLSRSGVVEQKAPRKEFVITEPVSVFDGQACVYALPYNDETLNVTYDLDYAGHTGIPKQSYSCRVTAENFAKNLADARTFLLEAEAKQFQSRGMGKHLSMRDILIIDSDGPIKNSFRYPNECVRHKVVDLIGDIALAGRAIKGRIVAYRSGHSLNQKLAGKLYEMAEQADRMEKTGSNAILDIRQIARVLPHRYPFLLVDRVIEVEGQTRIKGIKNVTFNEPFFQGHFPGTPIMPGVLIVEAMAQVSGLLFAQRLEHTGRLAVLLAMDKVKLRKAVVPGDQLVLMAETMKIRSRTAQCKCKAMVKDSLVAEAEIKFMLVDDEKI
ncbi:MAG: UDP-3-O-acyl-N-acetylglucosamine deacetylase [Planctomycetota bacterium]